MKKVIIAALAVLVLLTSCTIAEDKCYYAYFGDSAFLLVYSAGKNTLYKVDIPMDCLVIWAKANNYTNMKDVMLDYVQLRSDGFMIGNVQTHEALNQIIDALAGQKLENSEQRLETIVKNRSVLKNTTFVENINKLCSTSLSDLAKIIVSKKPDICCFDTGDFLMKDSEYSQKYFTQWLGQIL